MGLFRFAYYLGYRIKKHYALSNARRLPLPVISIGNITVGGTGKTPHVIAVAREAISRGYSPCVLTRGYGGSEKGPAVVSRGFGDIMSADMAGDEPALIAGSVDGLAVVKGPDRYEAGLLAIEELKGAIDIFILDDGFQHWLLKRDMDIVLLDAARPFDDWKLLPVGLLREPVSAISRADIIIVTRADDSALAESSIGEIKNICPDTPIYASVHKTLDVVSADGGPGFDLDWLQGREVFAFCGIASPKSFISSLENSGAVVKGARSFSDHYRYSQRDVDAISDSAKKAGCGWIITTEKDIMRLRGLRMPGNLVSLRIAAEVERAFYDELFSGIANQRQV